MADTTTRFLAQVFQGRRQLWSDKVLYQDRNQFGLPNYPRNDGNNGSAQADFVFRNYASRLPEVYSGHPNRVERYNQYENMDMDSEVNACLDIIAEFSTQLNQKQTAHRLMSSTTTSPLITKLKLSRSNCNSGSN
jgi:hypothetical protein